MDERPQAGNPVRARDSASSRATTRIVDSLLSLDRGRVSRLMATCIVFKTEGRSNRELLRFLVADDLAGTLRVVLHVLPSMLAGVVEDAGVRALAFTLATSTIRRGPKGRGPTRKRSTKYR